MKTDYKSAVKYLLLSIIIGICFGIFSSNVNANELENEKQNVINNSVFIEGYGKKSAGTGSGFIIKGLSGYIITNKHVINDMEIFRVSGINKNKFYAKVKYVSKIYDLAVLELDGLKLKTNGIPLCENSNFKFNYPLYNFGNPSGLDFTFTKGYISRIKQKHSGFPSKMLFHNDLGFSGQSGSAVIDSHNHCVAGVLTAAYTPTDIGLSIPVENLKDFITEFKISLL